MISEKEYKEKIDELTYQINKYKKAITDSGLDYYDFNLSTGEADQSFIIGKSLGLQPEEFDTIGKRSALFHPDDLKQNYKEIDRVIKGESDQFDIQSRLYRKDGSLLWIQHSGTLSYHPITKEMHLVGLLRDITQEKANTISLKQLADFDGLTKAYNRRSGLAKLESDVEAFENVTIIYIDVDKLKYINDTYGHSVGDQTLISFCEKVNEFMQKPSYLIRMGGDEFLCVLLNQSETVVKDTVNNLISNPVIYENQPEEILFFSYGIVTFDRYKYENVDEFIRDADEQMYIFKRKRERQRSILERV